MASETKVRREWCLRCERVFDAGSQERCDRAPDRGEHEAASMTPGEGVRRGFSLHIGSCPRSNASTWLPRRVPCLCGTEQGETTCPD